MQPQNESVGAIAGLLRRQILFGMTLEQAVQYVHGKYPLTPIEVFREAEATAAAEVAAQEQYSQLGYGEQLLEAYDVALPITRRVGVRFRVEFTDPRGESVFRTYAIDVNVTDTREQIEAEVTRLIERDLEAKYDVLIARYSETGLAEMSIASVLTEPLPHRIP